MCVCVCVCVCRCMYLLHVSLSRLITGTPSSVFVTLLYIDSVEEAEGGDGQDGASEGNGQCVFQRVLFIISMLFLLHIFNF